MPLSDFLLPAVANPNFQAQAKVLAEKKRKKKLQEMQQEEMKKKMYSPAMVVRG